MYISSPPSVQCFVYYIYLPISLYPNPFLNPDTLHLFSSRLSPVLISSIAQLWPSPPSRHTRPQLHPMPPPNLLPKHLINQPLLLQHAQPAKPLTRHHIKPHPFFAFRYRRWTCAPYRNSSSWASLCPLSPRLHVSVPQKSCLKWRTLALTRWETTTPFMRTTAGNRSKFLVLAFDVLSLRPTLPTHRCHFLRLNCHLLRQREGRDRA